jgi:hypothetical protein
LGASLIAVGTLLIAGGIGLFCATQFHSTWGWWV